MRKSISLVRIAAIALVGLLGAGTNAAFAQTIKPAYVEMVAPAKPYRTMVTLDSNLQINYSGPGRTTNSLAITSITLSHYFETDVAEIIRIFQVTSPSQTCDQTLSGGALEIGPAIAEITLPKYSTVHLTFPTPLVLKPIDGFVCVQVRSFKNVRTKTMINGFLF